MKKLRIKKFKYTGLKGTRGLTGAKPLTGKTGLKAKRPKKLSQYP